MKLRLFALIVFSLVSASVNAGERLVECSAQAIDTEGKAIVLAGVRYYFGKSKDALVKTLDAAAIANCRQKFTGLDAGTWYFGAKSYTADGTESELSNIVSVVVPKAAPVAPVLQ